MNEVKIAFKGFDKNWKCRDFQYEVGKSYVHDGVVEVCEFGFHSCEYPLDIFNYYMPIDNKFAIVEASGEIATHSCDSKIASAQLHVKAELKIPELVSFAVKWILGNIKDINVATNTGNYSAATNTGNYSAATNTGNYSAATNTGNYSAATNTGDQSAATNTGDRSAATNTGDRSAATVEGKNSVAIATGVKSKAKAVKGSAIVLCEYDNEGTLIKIKSAIAGTRRVKADTFYTLIDGKFTEVK